MIRTRQKKRSLEIFSSPVPPRIKRQRRRRRKMRKKKYQNSSEESSSLEEKLARMSERKREKKEIARVKRHQDWLSSIPSTPRRTSKNTTYHNEYEEFKEKLFLYIKFLGYTTNGLILLYLGGFLH